jgi:hypothetical protein
MKRNFSLDCENYKFFSGQLKKSAHFCKDSGKGAKRSVAKLFFLIK